MTFGSAAGRRRRVLGPVLVAVVFLAVIGASVGFLLGTRDNGGGDPGGGTTAGQTEDPGTGTGPEPPPQPPAASGAECPEHTEGLAQQAGASGELSRKLYIRTARSEVWICADDEGRLFYQGHTGGPGGDFVEGENALFLTDVGAEGDSVYVAKNTDAGQTRYRVSIERLVIEQKDKDDLVEPVVTYEN